METSDKEMISTIENLSQNNEDCFSTIDPDTFRYKVSELSQFSFSALKSKAIANARFITLFAEQDISSYTIDEIIVPRLKNEIKQIFAEIISRGENPPEISLPALYLNLDYSENPYSVALKLGDEYKIKVNYYPQTHGTYPDPTSVDSQFKIYKNLRNRLAGGSGKIAIFEEGMYFDADDPTKRINSSWYSDYTQDLLRENFPRGCCMDFSKLTERQKELLTNNGPAAVLKAQRYNVEWVAAAKEGRGAFYSEEGTLKILHPKPEYPIELKSGGSLSGPDNTTKWLDRYNQWEAEVEEWSKTYGKYQHEMRFYGREIDTLNEIDLYHRKNPDIEIALIFGAGHDFKTYNNVTAFDIDVAEDLDLRISRYMRSSTGHMRYNVGYDEFAQKSGLKQSEEVKKAYKKMIQRKQELEEIEKNKKLEIERNKKIEMERIKKIEMEKAKKIEMERQQLEMEKAKKIEMEKAKKIELERQQLEIERKKIEMEKAKKIEMEKAKKIEMEKAKKIEMERQQLEMEKAKKIEMERRYNFDRERHELELERKKIEMEINKLELEIEKFKVQNSDFNSEINKKMKTFSEDLTLKNKQTGAAQTAFQNSSDKIRRSNHNIRKASGARYAPAIQTLLFMGAVSAISATAIYSVLNARDEGSEKKGFSLNKTSDETCQKLYLNIYQATKKFRKDLIPDI